MDLQTYYYIITFFVVINLAAFLIMLLDKNKSRNRNNYRIPEGALFFMAICFGSIGVYIGMLTLRHKTQRWYFIVGVPLLIVQNISFLYLIYNILA